MPSRLAIGHFDCAVRGTGSALDEDGVLEIDTTSLIRNHLACYGRSSCSNYDIFLTRDCLAYAKLKPAHILLPRRCCGQHRMARHRSCLDDPVLKISEIYLIGLAEKYKKTVAQIVLKWGMQRNTVVIPKTSKLERLKENYQVFEFGESKEDMDMIKSMDRKYRTDQPAKFWGIDLYA
ncbi:hypothetical protein Patl1_36568 [Pistacia atlantica]|nr:hypothetical protein Patl1_36568 [Pistacia atlantica]